MSADQYTPQDPRQQYWQPDEQRPQRVPHPGLTAEMAQRPDHGEDSYRGSVTGGKPIT